MNDFGHGFRNAGEFYLGWLGFPKKDKILMTKMFFFGGFCTIALLATVGVVIFAAIIVSL